MEIQYIDWGLIEYAEAWNRQRKLFDERVQAKFQASDSAQPLPDVAIFCEHPPVYTLGKSGVLENLLVNNSQLKERGATFFRTDRGGDITFHGPGQQVVYPVIDLEHGQLGLKAYIHKLEEAVIRLLDGYGVKAGRLEQATGVWLEPELPGRARKICAIGVKSSRFITMHGLALNINTDLSFFHAINPCGFVDKGVTSLSLECGRPIDMDACKQQLFQALKAVFAE
jgi:lipoyl(octanoyl) transferase